MNFSNHKIIKKGIFNVKTAGAMGDGRTDDTAVFQNLLDSSRRASF
jgi:polygalacturonase